MQCDQTKYFTCNTGDCIDIDRRCDEISDCEDESDELNDLCQIAYINTKTYVKSNVPLPSGDEVNSRHLNVAVGFTLSEIGKSRNSREHALRHVTSFVPVN